ncbi:TLG2B [Arabidopsis thaliana]|uniref:TLG2B n=1 Tax=Arabidopsis thaliana TaxID=3702 RepID=A0A178V2H7_ARATH|nr:TLG2B [Arabidopsis thaliana]
MATRNRTTVYRKHRDACKSARAPLSLSASDSFGGPVIEMVSGSFSRSNHSSYAPLNSYDPGPSSSDAFTIGMPPAWVDDSEEITFNIQKVRDKMNELAKAHSKALMPTFGDNKGIHREVEMLTHEITDLLRKSEKRLQMLSTRGPSEESNLRKNVQVGCWTLFQNRAC